MKKLASLLALLSLIFSACGTSTPVATPLATATLIPLSTKTSTVSPTTPQPTITPSLTLIDGTLTIKVNVRSGPATTYDSLGQLDAGTVVQVTVRDAAGVWVQILYPAAPQGRGWVAAQYVTLAAGVEVPLDVTPTPAGPTGRVIQQLNVRSGPGTTFDSLGLLQPGTVVTLIGKNATASWFQIDYPSGPSGHGWVTSQYIQTEAIGLPVLDDFGGIVTPGTTGTPSAPDVPPTPTVGPAYDDGDSSLSPGVRVTFSSTGTRRFIYSSQVSAPQGDPEDWVSFTPYSSTGSDARLDLSLECVGNGTLTVELWQGGALFPGWGSLACGDVGNSIKLPASQDYRVRMAPGSGAGLRLISYTLTVQNFP